MIFDVEIEDFCLKDRLVAGGTHDWNSWYVEEMKNVWFVFQILDENEPVTIGGHR